MWLFRCGGLVSDPALPYRQIQTDLLYDPTMTTHSWKCALELRPDRSIAAGSAASLCDAIRRGADLRVYTEWLYEEHIAPDIANPDPRYNGVLQEIIDMRETMLVDDRYAAGITTLRQPLQPIAGFNPAVPNRMSYFMYGMDGQQFCATVMLDDTKSTAAPGSFRVVPRPKAMPKMSETEENDIGTLAPSRNFIYDFEVYRYFVRDDWTPILSHDESGRVTSGSWDAFHQAHREGREFKVGIAGLCSELPGASLRHEVFTLLGSGWVHTAMKTHEVSTHPLVRVVPAIPMKYRSRGWDVAWVIVRTDGKVKIRSLDPYTRTFRDRETRLACRWFVR